MSNITQAAWRGRANRERCGAAKAVSQSAKLYLPGGAKAGPSVEDYLPCFTASQNTGMALVEGRRPAAGMDFTPPGGILMFISAAWSCG